MKKGDYVVLTDGMYNVLPLYIVEILWIDFEAVCSVRTIKKISGEEIREEHVVCIEELKPLNYLKSWERNHET